MKIDEANQGDKLAEDFAASPELYERFCEVVIEASNEAATNAINNGEGIEWLLLLGWSVSDIRKELSK